MTRLFGGGVEKKGLRKTSAWVWARIYRHADQEKRWIGIWVEAEI